MDSFTKNICYTPHDMLALINSVFTMKIGLKVGGLNRETWGQVAANSSLVDRERESKVEWVVSLGWLWHTFTQDTW